MLCTVQRIKKYFSKQHFFVVASLKKVERLLCSAYRNLTYYLDKRRSQCISPSTGLNRKLIWCSDDSQDN